MPRVALVSMTALFLACAPSSAGVAAGSDNGSAGASASAATGSSETGGGGVGNAGTAGSAGASASGGAGGGGSGASSVPTSGASGTIGAGAGSTAAGDTDGGAVDDAAVDELASPDAELDANWVLTWSDEFNAEAGTKPDPTYWSYDLGGGGWGVGQLQTYTNSAANAATDGMGNLAIVAIKDAQGNFTSARIKTQGKFQQAYGRFEIRAKVVTGNGMWPAFWMLGDNFDTAGWPQCGEIDIMEVRGTRPYTNGGSLHGPGYSGQHPLSGSFSLPEGGPTLSDDFHTYAIEWAPDVVHFFVDENLFETHTPADIPAGAGPWVYDHPFFILINVAVGGTYPGPPDGTVFPQTMLVDYVRVYEAPDAGD